MPVQRQDARKNYIGILNDTTEDEWVAEGAAPSRSRVMSYLAGLLAAVLEHPRKGASGR
jgi:hypothetical protein